jgi:hypothetical protein
VVRIHAGEPPIFTLIAIDSRTVPACAREHASISSTALLAHGLDRTRALGPISALPLPLHGAQERRKLIAGDHRSQTRAVRSELVDSLQSRPAVEVGVKTHREAIMFRSNTARWTASRADIWNGCCAISAARSTSVFLIEKTSYTTARMTRNAGSNASRLLIGV